MILKKLNRNIRNMIQLKIKIYLVRINKTIKKNTINMMKNIKNIAIKIMKKIIKFKNL